MKIKIIGLDNLEKRLDPDKWKHIEQKGFLVGAEVLKGFIQEKTPVDTGILRQSYKIKKEENKVIVYNTKKYGLYLHEGTKPHWTSVKNVSKWAKRHNINPYAVVRAIARKGTKGRHWIDKVLETKSNLVFKSIERFISKNI